MHQYLLRQRTENMKSALVLIFLCPVWCLTEPPIRVHKNNGVQQFQEVGFLLDDVVPARLLVEITLQLALKAVYKVKSYLRHKDANDTLFRKVLQAGLNTDTKAAA